VTVQDFLNEELADYSAEKAFQEVLMNRVASSNEPAREKLNAFRGTLSSSMKDTLVQFLKTSSRVSPAGGALEPFTTPCGFGCDDCSRTLGKDETMFSDRVTAWRGRHMTWKREQVRPSVETQRPSALLTMS
jgi:hypothetical protein